MANNKKQLKLTKLFRKEARLPEGGDDLHDLHEEIKLLEKQVKEKHDELFQLQRNSHKFKHAEHKKKAENFVRPQKIILNNSVESYKQDLELMSMLTGMEVQSYVANDHCCIVYHLQHDAQHAVKHGLRIDMQSGNNVISKSSLPPGFNLNAVLEDYDNVMMPDCLGAIRKALVAYYERLEQYEALKKLVNIEAQLFKKMDGSHVEISFIAKNDVDESEPINVVLMVDYRVYDIRPKTLTFKEIDLPEGAVEALREQCVVFKRKPLNKAFREAFIDGIGPYKLAQQIGPPRKEQLKSRRRHRPRPPTHYNNDDTFRPEECTEESDNSGEEN